MNNNDPRRRRWFQFRLRSVLLLMLGVGLWLGYEVNWASRQQRHVTAIEELGGSVYYERRRWSLLRWVDAQKYGRQVTKVEIRGADVADAVAPLTQFPRLRQVRVVYNGSCDLYPRLEALKKSLAGTDILAIGEMCGLILGASGGTRYTRPVNWMDNVIKSRLAGKGFDGLYTHQDVLGFEYHVARLANGSACEVFVLPEVPTSGLLSREVILLVRDRIVDKIKLPCGLKAGVVVEDLDGDGWFEMGVPPGDSGVRNTLPGDRRRWWDVFDIEPTRFHSLFPNDR